MRGKRAEEWTAAGLAELVEEPRRWLAELVLEVARDQDWQILDEEHLLPDEPTNQVSGAFAIVRHLADTGRLKEGP